MALDFPDSPSNGQLFSDGTRTWSYDGTVWSVVPLEGASTSEPMGFPNRTDSTLSFNNSTRTVTLGIASTSTYFEVWNKGKKFRYIVSQSVQIPDTSGLWYIYINNSGQITYRDTYFDWESDTPVAYVYWNATDQVNYFFADERHGIVLDWQTHEYLHRTRGAVIANGFGANNYVIDGDGSLDSHAQIDIADGTFFDEDLEVSIVHSATPTSNTWEQFLQGPAQLPVMYRSGSVWVRDTATDFPLKAGVSLPRYNSGSGSSWGLTDIGNAKFGVMWVAATNNLSFPVISIMGQGEYNTVGAAEAVGWEELDLSGFPVFEFRVLYKIVFQAASGYSNAVKAAFRGVYDLRRVYTAGESIPAVPISDHGSLTGLADDDHTQYLLADGTRTASSLNISGDTTVGSNVKLTDGTSFAASSVGTVSTTTTVSQTIDSSAADSVKYVVYVSDGTDRQVTELLAVQDGVDVFYVQYANVVSGSSELSSFDVSYSAGSIVLEATPAVSNLTFKIHKVSIS